MKRKVKAMFKKTCWQVYFVLLLFSLSSSQSLYGQLDTLTLSVSNSVGIQQISVDITVENFNKIVSGQFSVVWNASVLEFDSIENVGLPTDDFLTNLFADDVLNVLFVDQDFPFDGFTLSDGATLLTIYFNVIGTGVSPVSILDDFVEIEFVRETEIIPYKINNGEVNGEGAWVRGQVILDDNQDCMNTVGEKGVEGWIINMRDDMNDLDYYATTDEAGFYSIFVGLGSYELSTSPEYQYWSLCQSNFNLELTTLDEIELVNFFAQIEGTFIQGRVFDDSENGNCIDDGELGFQDWQVLIAGAEEYVVSTNSKENTVLWCLLEPMIFQSLLHCIGKLVKRM